MSKNKNLTKAKAEKNDEFYTQLGDIENELRHYRKFFKDKVVYCNCDDCYESNFFKYFALNFKFLGLKRLITTCYGSSKMAYGQLTLPLTVTDTPDTTDTPSPSNERVAYKIDIKEVDDYNGDGAYNMADVDYLLRNKKNTLSVLKGDGDFRSQECLALLNECDIVVTNPPFSLFREFISTITNYNKDFIVLGNMNAITYKEIFPLIKNGIIKTGYVFNKALEFSSPYKNTQNDSGLIKVPAICWYTSLPIDKREDSLLIDLYKKYYLSDNTTNPDYPRYDNYDAINVNKVCDIPIDYYGVMGVPITFLDKYNPNEFEIVGMLNVGCYLDESGWQGSNGKHMLFIDGKDVYKRILIKRKGVNTKC